MDILMGRGWTEDYWLTGVTMAFALFIILAVSLAQDSQKEPVRSISNLITVEELLAHIKLNKLSELDCPDVPEERLLQLAKITYGDLNGDGQNEAVVVGASCMVGTGGADIFGVFTRTASKSITDLPISQERNFQGRDVYQGSMGHWDLQAHDGKLAKTFPLYRAGEPNCCPTGGTRIITYTWNGSMFVISEIRDEGKD